MCACCHPHPYSAFQLVVLQYLSAHKHSNQCVTLYSKPNNTLHQPTESETKFQNKFLHKSQQQQRTSMAVHDRQQRRQGDYYLPLWQRLQHMQRVHRKHCSGGCRQASAQHRGQARQDTVANQQCCKGQTSQSVWRDGGRGGSCRPVFVAMCLFEVLMLPEVCV